MAKAFEDEIDSDFTVYTEACINPHNLNSPAPDVIVFLGNPAENENAIPVVFVEVTTKAEFKIICQKAQDLILEFDTVTEAFVYDYETNLWACYGRDSDLENPSYCNYFNFDLDDCL